MSVCQSYPFTWLLASTRLWFVRKHWIIFKSLRRACRCDFHVTWSIVNQNFSWFLWRLIIGQYLYTAKYKLQINTNANTHDRASFTFMEHHLHKHFPKPFWPPTNIPTLKKRPTQYCFLFRQFRAQWQPYLCYVSRWEYFASMQQHREQGDWHMTLNNTLHLRLATKGCIFSLASLHQVDASRCIFFGFSLIMSLFLIFYTFWQCVAGGQIQPQWQWGVSVGGSLSLLLHETTAIDRKFCPQLKYTATTTVIFLHN